MKLTRSAYNHSVNFRSVIIFGKARELKSNKEKLAGLKNIVNHFVPERWNHCRQPNIEELNATRVIEIEIESASASAKISNGPAEDKKEDYDLDYWSGIIPVHGELLLKLLREAGIALGSEPANGSYSMWFAVLDYLQLHQPAYHRRVSYGCDVGCNRLGSLRVFSPGQPHSRIVYGQEILGE